MRTATTAAVCTLITLLAATQSALAVKGTVITAGSRFQGEIRWLGASRAYEINDARGIGKQISQAQVVDVIIPKPPALDKAAKLVAKGSHAQAVSPLEKILEDYEMLKWDITAARWLAEAYLNLNKLSQAESMCQKVFRQNPAAKTSGELSRIYWEVLEKANKHATLEMILKDAIKSGGREVAAVAQIKRGDMANSKGKTKEALIDGYLRTAVLFRDVKSVQPEALFKATKALKKIGKVTDAEKMRKRLLEGYPESRYAQQLRGSQ